jgi:protein-S-isoprenylcysteine O-methyltransferase Ste14
MWNIYIFVCASIGILIFSLPSLRHTRSHGFWRFFAFESVLALILLNVEYWFRNPFSALQISSWLLLIGSIFLVLHGFYLLMTTGRPEQTANIEKTTRLVRTGAYRYIRHPLYASLFYLGWGVFLKNLSVASALLIFALTFFLIITTKAEERENIAKWGDEYSSYMRETKMFIPFLF